MNLALKLKQSQSKHPYSSSFHISAHKVEPGRKEDVGDEAEANDDDDQAHEVPVELSGADLQEAENDLCVWKCASGWVDGMAEEKGTIISFSPCSSRCWAGPGRRHQSSRHRRSSSADN